MNTTARTARTITSADRREALALMERACRLAQRVGEHATRDELEEVADTLQEAEEHRGCDAATRRILGRWIRGIDARIESGDHEEGSCHGIYHAEIEAGWRGR